MSEIKDAYGERKKKEVMENTFGHLAPEKDRAYGDIVCIQNHFRDLPDSPWFYKDHFPGALIFQLVIKAWIILPLLENK